MGGFPAWQAAGLPVSDEQVNRIAAPFHGAARCLRPGRHAGRVRRLNPAGDSHDILDARPQARFEGETARAKTRACGPVTCRDARNVPFTDLMEDGRLKSADALKGHV
jgi:thiosulfate/3-mercaptopyruvate sulfurtransferase